MLHFDREFDIASEFHLVQMQVLLNVFEDLLAVEGLHLRRSYEALMHMPSCLCPQMYMKNGDTLSARKELNFAKTSP